MSGSPKWRPSGMVFIANGRPFLAHRGWVHARTGDGDWYTVRKLDPLELVPQVCTPEECAMYGVDYSEDIREPKPARSETKGGDHA